MGKTNCLMILLLLLNINCYRGIVKKQENGYQIEGVVSYKDKALPGAAVEIFLENEVLKNGFSKEPFIRLKTDSNGQFKTSLLQNNYFFKAGKDDLFCYFGGNPVVLVDSIKDLFLKCVRGHNVKVDKNSNFTKPKLTGKIIDTNGRALENAGIYLFSASNPEFRRMADLVSEPTLKDGSFSITFDTVGSYFVIVRKRRNAEEKGPLKTGDYYGYYYANPLKINDKTKNYLLMECIEKKKDRLPANVINIPVGKSAIRGRIIDKNGDPVSGVFAFTYKYEYGTGKKPDYKSMITGEDGAYTIIIEEEGPYVLGARKTHGGPSEPGDIFGFFGGAKDHKIDIKKSEVINNIDITVEEVK